MATSLNHESAVADEQDGILNTFQADKFSGVFAEVLHNPVAGFGNEADNGLSKLRFSDFTTVFDYNKVKSHLNWKNTTGR